jgi:hypothetical protein
MFYNCYNASATEPFTMAIGFNLPSGITSAEDYFCQSMFYNCKAVTMTDGFNLPGGITSVGVNFCQDMFSSCDSVTMTDGFNLPGGITSVGVNFCQTMFSSCDNVTMSTGFALPTGITSVKENFCYYMFYRCRNLVVQDTFKFPNLSDDEVRKPGVFQYTFYNLQLHQTVAAGYIINGASLPDTPRGTFYAANEDAVWEDYNTINSNWITRPS